MRSMQALQRKGAWLIAEQGQWKMASVQGPIAIDDEDREYFRVETACREVLLVSRRLGEKGMRELRLDCFITPLAREFIPPPPPRGSRKPGEERKLQTAPDAEKTVA